MTRYSKICTIIGIPQLACLAGHEPPPSVFMGVRMSVLEASWNAANNDNPVKATEDQKQ